MLKRGRYQPQKIQSSHLKFLSDCSGIERANEIHVRHKELSLIDALTFIPGETQDDQWRIAIDFPEFRRIPKAGHINY